MTETMEALRAETATIEGGRLDESETAETVTTTPIPAPGSSVRVAAKGTEVAVFNVEGRLYGLEARCSHREGPLDQGTISDAVVKCPWHGAQFDLESGAVVGGNFFVRRASRPLRAFRVRSAEGYVAIAERGVAIL
jgi:3-phenylpropionate/trans-cinnamate dioxygenase ferredoxin component